MLVVGRFTAETPSRHTGAMDLLDQPHHDGSTTYVDNPTPAPGDLVTVRARTGAHDPVVKAWVRTTTDAEPIFLECTRTEGGKASDGATWWQAQVPMHNPMMNYRSEEHTSELQSLMRISY